MNIAIVFDDKINVGGGYQQTLNITNELINGFENKHNLFIIGTFKKNRSVFEKDEKITYLDFFNTISNRLIIFFRKNKLSKYILRKLRLYPQNPFDKLLIKNNIDLIIFTGQSGLALKTELHNYIIFTWDFCHRYMPEFKEVSKNNTFESRELFYSKVLPKAVAVIVDSEISKRDAIRYYNLNEDRVKVLKYLPASFVNIRNNTIKDSVNIKDMFNIKNDYIFYPAQFWAHKNHIYILDALYILKKNYNKIIDAVFVGSDKGNLKHIINYAESLNIKEQIHFPGFVENEIMPHLYKQSMALVMPTYIGPTNMPPIEAFSLGVPVLYTEPSEYLESYGNATLNLDLKFPDSLAKSIILLENSIEIKNNLINEGYKHIQYINENHYYNLFNRIFESYEYKLKSWK